MDKLKEVFDQSKVWHFVSSKSGVVTEYAPGILDLVVLILLMWMAFWIGKRIPGFLRNRWNKLVQGRKMRRSRRIKEALKRDMLACSLYDKLCELQNEDKITAGEVNYWNKKLEQIGLKSIPDPNIVKEKIMKRMLKTLTPEQIKERLAKRNPANKLSAIFQRKAKPA